MKIALICNASEQIGVQYLSACLKQKGYTVKLFLDPSLFNDRIVFNFDSLEKYFSVTRRLVQAVHRWRPDLIGISTVTITFPWAKYVAEQLKALTPEVPIIVGGSHVMLTPDVVLQEPCFDMACTGEGEEAIVELAASIDAGERSTEILDIWFKEGDRIIQNPLRRLNEDLDELPFPDRSVFESYLNMSDSLLSMSMRGCLLRCSYCSHNVIRDRYKGKGCYVRRKSPQRYIEELRYFKEKYEYAFVRIYDDIFTYDIKWLEEFTPLYRRFIDKPFFCLGHPRYLKEEAVALIKEAGCNWIQVGIESLNQETRQKFLNRPESDSEVFQAIERLEKYELKYELDFIFGLPGDDENTYNRTVDLLKKTKSLNRVSALMLSYLPKTEIIDHSIENNDITAQDINSIEQGLEGCQTQKGSIRDAEKKRMAEQYNLLYRFCAFLSEKQIDFIRRKGLVKFLVYLNPFLLYFIRILGMDAVDKIFVKSFFRQFLHVILKRRSFYHSVEEKTVLDHENPLS